MLYDGVEFEGLMNHVKVDTGTIPYIFELQRNSTDISTAACYKARLQCDQVHSDQVHQCWSGGSDMLTSKLLPRAAGLSNTITALTGAGLTGSYIFSQTIFSMRAGVHTRLHGAIIAGKPYPPAAVACSPVSISPCAAHCQPFSKGAAHGQIRLEALLACAGRLAGQCCVDRNVLHCVLDLISTGTAGPSTWAGGKHKVITRVGGGSLKLCVCSEKLA